MLLLERRREYVGKGRIQDSMVTSASVFRVAKVAGLGVEGYQSSSSLHAGGPRTVHLRLARLWE